MTTYSICKASGESLGTFEADSAAGARDAWARSWGYQRHADMPSYAEETSLIITAVGLPEAPATQLADLAAMVIALDDLISACKGIDGNPVAPSREALSKATAQLKYPRTDEFFQALIKIRCEQTSAQAEPNGEK